LPKYQFVPITPDGRRGEAVPVSAYDDAVAMKRALILPGAAAWDVWRGVKHVGCIAAPAPVRAEAEEAQPPQAEAA
jgi:hypothetical protein